MTKAATLRRPVLVPNFCPQTRVLNGFRVVPRWSCFKEHSGMTHILSDMVLSQ